LGLYIVVSVGVSIHKYFCVPGNYMIFATSFWNLVNGVDIYFPVPRLWDYHKYSPSFSALFAPMAVMPVLLGAIMWNLLNTITFYLAVKSLKIEQKARAFIFWFVIFDYITSLQNFQSNVLIAGLFIATLNFLDNEKPISAALMTVLSFSIKLFGAASGLLFVFYPNKKKFILYGILWTVIIAALPLLFVSPSWLMHLYQSWYKILNMDFYGGNYNYSIMMLIHRVAPIPKLYIQITGLALLLLPLIVSYKQFSEYKNRLIYMASMMIWVIIFNHKAESPTFIIAATGAAIWYVNCRKTILDKILIVGVFVFTTLSYTELMAMMLKKCCDMPTVKVIPCVLVWFKIQFDLLSAKSRAR